MEDRSFNHLSSSQTRDYNIGISNVSMWHSGVRAMTDWLEVSIKCPDGVIV
jgi:hypothetical protein